MNIAVREIRTSDISQISQLIQISIKRSWLGYRSAESIKMACKKYTPAKLIKRLEDDSFIYWVAENEDGNQLVGIIGLKENQLRTFFVHPQYQGQGVGRKLYDVLEEYAKTNKIQKLTVEGSINGEPVYKKFGFTKIKTLIKKRPSGTYTDALMEKIINQTPV